MSTEFQIGDIVSHSYNPGAEYQILCRNASGGNYRDAWMVLVLKRGDSQPFSVGDEIAARGEYMTLISRPGTIAAPQDPPDLDSLRAIADGKSWRVGYSRLETLINQGYVNAMGTRLTEKGKQCL